MPNKRYISGRNFEYKVKHYLETKGYLVFRTAGSHSVADLIAFPMIDCVFDIPCLIQCKHHGKISQAELKDAVKAEAQYPFTYIVAAMKGRKLVFSGVARTDPLVLFEREL